MFFLSQLQIPWSLKIIELFVEFMDFAQAVIVLLFFF